jgi:hypothetical protein
MIPSLRGRSVASASCVAVRPADLLRLCPRLAADLSRNVVTGDADQVTKGRAGAAANASVVGYNFRRILALSLSFVSSRS